ncbi:universal stress protein [Streptococcus pneumoniae]|jgi:nucleotide-binding universal stress UspA family protein|uniref:Universal stress protein n=2 Tax=Stutzerimonas stutzeri TaxID=316 RepID=A0A3S4RED7_STUST|nr:MULTISPECIES: universal stress protein [Stutzerimonas]EPL60938.1 universal stress protein [Stutzerimonas stutzeri B1SMN1]MBW8335871.1 universal stress protein [Pseudomonas sp.]MCJ0877667.1 universal stress protein [Pseudomonas sp. JI-2]NMY64837.1 universal stress protein [Pseudomonas sp. WS 5018]OHC21018.1 MAG: universal stress protein [Pseudomonadales bacterium RIFCSPHIGHO2_01_FULL_64_12]TDL95756.1 universal stress protein [Stutzerimonas stutzeri ATCC 17588 = LMG 11199]CJK45558.1 univers
MRRLLVAYDGSDNSKRALQYVVDLARDTGMALQVHVVNVQHEPIIYGEYVTSAMIDELNNSLMAKSRSVLDEAAAMLQAGGLTCETHTQLGNVAEQINDAVKRLGCDTVVMGTRGLGSFTGLVLGSVASRVIHEVSVPVLLVK